MHFLRLVPLCLTLLLLFPVIPYSQTADAASIARPTGRVILTITGMIERTNSEKGVAFDRDMLEEIGMVDIKTTTPFTSGETVFRSMRMRDLLRYVGARGGMIEATALDLYKAEIPISDFDDEDVILALVADGKKLRVRDRGPAWIMYPFSGQPALDNEIIHARCIWQLVSLSVK